MLNSMRGSVQNRKNTIFVSAVCLAISASVPPVIAEGGDVTGTGVTNTAGTSSGGTSVFSAAESLNNGNLVVSAGSTLVVDVGQLTSGQVQIPGNITNNGTIFAFSSNQSVTTAVFLANNIFNNAGGLFTTALPTGGIANFDSSSIVGNLNLVLNAVNNIVNNGTISSAGNLSMTAGASITNTATMSALQNINLQAMNILNSGQIAAQLGSIAASTANLNNSNIMQALSGSISIQNVLGSTLSVNNTLGSITARDSVLFQTLAPVIDSAGLLHEAGISLNGGSIAAKSIEFVSPDGHVAATAEHLNGGVSVRACTAAINATAGDLMLSNIELTGDPIFSANGDLDLGGLFNNPLSTFLTLGGDFVGLATRNIKSSRSGTINTVPPLIGEYGKITLAAGVNFTVSNGKCTDCSNSYKILGTSESGGSVNLSNVNLRTAGRDVSVVAHAGCQSAGNINLGDVNSSGIIYRDAGNVTISALDGLIMVGTICAAGAEGLTSGANGGRVEIKAADGISTGSIIATGGTPLIGDGGRGGAVSLSVLHCGDITTGIINTSGGNAGTVFDGAVGAKGKAGTSGSVGPVGVAGFAGVGGSAGGPGLPGGPGGQGGPGGVGGRGSDGLDGGQGSQGARGGDAGAIVLNTNRGAVSVKGSLLALGGDGGTGGRGGAGGSGGAGGVGGKGGAGGIGGKGGSGASVEPPATSGNGGPGGNGGQGGIGGVGGRGGDGGDGGVGGYGGQGGNGGSIELKATKSITIGGNVTTSGGDGGRPGAGGNKGAGGNGGKGGGGGNGGSGGAGGSAGLTFPGQTPGKPGASGKAGVAGGPGTSGEVGQDGLVGAQGEKGGSGGSAGNININTSGTVYIEEGISFNGGSGADAGSAGDGGASASLRIHAGAARVDGGISGAGGAGGTGIYAGDGGRGGSVDIRVCNGSLLMANLSVMGGDGVDGLKQGGNGGSTGNITIQADGRFSANNIVLAGGRGGVATDKTGTGGHGGNAGSIDLSGGRVQIESIGVSGGDAGRGGGIAGVAGDAGSISVCADGSLQVCEVSNRGGNGDSGEKSGSRGGDTRDIRLETGCDLTVGTVTSIGGDGGARSRGGNSGAIKIKSDEDVRVGSICTSGGDGGNGSEAGAGGRSGSIRISAGDDLRVKSIHSSGGSGGSGALGGNGGSTGSIYLVACDDLTAGVIKSYGGDGGSGTKTGGDGGNTGAINLSSHDGSVSVCSIRTVGGDGGNAKDGDGGDGGSSGSVALSADCSIESGHVKSAGGDGGYGRNRGGDGANAGSVSLDAGGSICSDSICVIGGDGGNSRNRSAGDGGNTGMISLNSDHSSVYSGVISSRGGDGGNSCEARGGDGGNVGRVVLSARRTVISDYIGVYGGNGGDGECAGSGGDTCSITLEARKGRVDSGAIVSVGGDGGDGYFGGNGGDTGHITLASCESKVSSDSIFSRGGDGGNGDSCEGYGGNGGDTGSIKLSAGGSLRTHSIVSQGGDGGFGAYGGSGGDSGRISVSASCQIQSCEILSQGGLGSKGKRGGGDGGDGGSIWLHTHGDLSAHSVISRGGTGGAGSSRDGGDGGDAGCIVLEACGYLRAGEVRSLGGGAGTGRSGGDGGNGGHISLSGDDVRFGALESGGGNGADAISRAGGNGGHGGAIAVSAAGRISGGTVQSYGGNGGAGDCREGGNGGNAGKIELEACSSICVETVSSAGGNGGNSNHDDAGKGGSGGSIRLASRHGAIHFGSYLISSGGMGGSVGSGMPGTGGDAGNITVYARYGVRGYDISSLGGYPGIGLDSKDPKKGAGRGGNGGNISVTSLKGDIELSNLFTSGVGAGRHAGDITLKAPKGSIFAMALQSAGLLNADAGNITTVSENLLVGCAECRGHRGGPGGVVIDASSYSWLKPSPESYGNGNAGRISLTTTSSNLLQIGRSVESDEEYEDGYDDYEKKTRPAPVVNGVLGGITANGFSGGRVEFRGGQFVTKNGFVQANGTDGEGGLILFTTDAPGTKPLTAIVDGFVQATNNKQDSGRIGFHSGPGQNLFISGVGSVDAGEFVSVGNLDLKTLDLAPVKAGVLSPYPSFALLVVHGEFRCNASNCFPVATVEALGVKVVETTKKTGIDFDLTLPQVLTQLPPSDLTKRSVPLGSNENNKEPRWLSQRPDDEFCVNWVISHQAGEVFGLKGDTQTALLATAGTAFSVTGDHMITLKSGNLTIITGDTPVTVITSLGPVTVPPNSSAVVGQNRFGGVSISSISGQATQMVVTHNGQSAQMVTPIGQTAHLQDNSLASAGTPDYQSSAKEGPIPGLNMSSQSNSGSNSAGESLQDAEVDMMTPEMKALYGNVMNSVQSSSGQQGGPKAQSAVPPQEIGYRQAANGNYFVPVAYNNSSSASRQLDQVLSISADTAVVKYLLGTRVSHQDNGIIGVKSGEALIRTSAPSIIAAGNCFISVAKGTMVLVSVKGNLVKVRNLCEHALNTVELKLAGRTTKLSAGQEAVLGPSDTAVVSEMHSDRLGRRRMNAVDFRKDGFAVTSCEFSLTALLQYSELLRHIYSSNDKADKQMTAELVKMAAVLTQVTGRHGTYQQVAANGRSY